MIRSAIKRRISTVVLALGLALFGAMNIQQIPVDFLPSIKYPLIKISMAWPGATPGDIERNLAEPIERQLASVDGLDYLSSSSLEGIYQLDVNFRYGVDVDVAYQDSLAAFQRAERDLPDGTEPAVIIKADPAQLPVVQVAFESDFMDLTELRTWVDTWLADRLLAARGVAAVDVAGGLEREIRVYLDSVLLKKHQLSLSLIEHRLQEENIDRIGGRVTNDIQETIVRTVGEFSDLEMIRNIVLIRNENGTLYLRDVARVEDGHEEVRMLTRLNGRPAVKVNIIKQADANTVQTVEAVEQHLATIRKAFPPGTRYALLENQAEHILDSIKGVSSSALQAAVLVIATFFLFLGSPRQVLIVTSLLPLCALGNFFLMKLAGFTLNIFSLGGLVVAIAIMLDAATVVIENITRLRLEEPDLPIPQIALKGVTQVKSAIVASAVAFFALFSPFFLVPGMITLLFGELVAIVLSITLLSLLGAIFWVPMLSGWLLRPVGKKQVGWNVRFNAFLLQSYAWLIDRVLRFRRLTLLVFLLAMGGGAFLFVRSGAEFFPSVDDGRVMVKVRMPAGVALDRLDAIIQKIENMVVSDSRVANVFAMSGGAVRGLYTNRIGNEGEVNIELVSADARDISTEKFVHELRPKVARLAAPGARIMVSQKQMRGIRALGQSEIEVEINGADIDKLFTTAGSLLENLRQRPELTNLDLSLDYSKPEWQIDIDRTRAAELGLTVRGIADTLQGYIGGHVPTRYREGSDLFDLRILVPERRLDNRDDVANLILSRPDGGYVRLYEVAAVQRASGPVEIARENQVKQVIVRADSSGDYTLSAAEAVIRSVIAEMNWPDGYTYSIGGKAQQMAEMKSVVQQLLLYALFFSFIVLAFQFNDLRLPFVIYLAAPFTLAGMGYGLVLAGMPFSATVIIGILIILAANVNDGVLLIQAAEELRGQGMPLLDATRNAAIQRMRPRLMTTLPIIIVFVPLAFAFQRGGELLRPMAAAVIGGLSLEVLAALFLVPVLYIWLAKKSAGQSSPEKSFEAIDVRQR
ncbi:MAG: efflux RND transporter permease subunit [Planctomycetes bacterium]|nr:efflux RND transporter permease subunit [Planctomycetota bacterium]